MSNQTNIKCLKCGANLGVMLLGNPVNPSICVECYEESTNIRSLLYVILGLTTVLLIGEISKELIKK